MLKSNNNYNIISLSDKQKLLLSKYSDQYKNNNLLPLDIINISNILHIPKGYVIFSSLDKVDLINTRETEDNNKAEEKL